MITARCLISNMPQKLLSDIVLGTVQQNINIEVVGEASLDDDLPAILKNKSADLLLIGMQRNKLPPFIDQMLDSNPNLMIVGLVDDGRGAAIFVNDIGADELTELIGTLGPGRTSQGE